MGAFTFNSMKPRDIDVLKMGQHIRKFLKTQKLHQAGWVKHFVPTGTVKDFPGSAPVCRELLQTLRLHARDLHEAVSDCCVLANFLKETPAKSS